MALTYEPSCGSHITNAAKSAVQMANSKHQSVTFKFNGVTVIVWPGEQAERVAAKWEQEFDRRVKQWRDGPEGRKHQERQRSESERHQMATDELVNTLGEAIDGGLNCVVVWCSALSGAADWIGVTWDRQQVIDRLIAAGYRQDEYVGQPAEWFTTRERMGRYIVGQALACMASGMPPHPMTQTFAERYLAIPD